MKGVLVLSGLRPLTPLLTNVNILKQVLISLAPIFIKIRRQGEHCVFVTCGKQAALSRRAPC